MVNEETLAQLPEDVRLYLRALRRRVIELERIEQQQRIADLEAANRALQVELDDALALDLRKPQDYFQRVWNTAFLASDLAKAGSSQDDDTLRAEHGDLAEMNA